MKFGYKTRNSNYVVPLFSRPIQSPDFQAYISKPRRRRFHDSQIWPDRYNSYMNKLIEKRTKVHN